jgi:Tol biopolymer transport system component
MDFGKNRIQYQNFIWTYFDFERYRVYSYQGGTEISKYVSVSMAKQLPSLEKRLDYEFDSKINVIVYNNQGDFKQSNIGLATDDQNNVGGVTKIIGDKIFVFFNGSHAELDIQIRSALAELLLNKILFDGNAREAVRNSALLNVPQWFTLGLIKYLSEGWTTQSDNLMYDDLKNNKFTSFNRLSGDEAARAGHALWYDIVGTYGEACIPQVLYMTRVSRSPDNAFLFVLGISLQNLIYDFIDAYNRRLFTFKDSLRKSPINNNSILKRYKSFRHYSQLKISSDGTKVIYARTELGQIRVYLKEIGQKKQKRLLKFGPKVEQLSDFNYPILAWHPNGKIVTMIYERKDQLVIHTVDLETNERVKRNLPGFEKINSASYSSDGKKFALSAVKKGKGQSDIFVFGINTSGIEQLTNDIWDDNNPVFIQGNKQIVFESNRLNDTVKPIDDANFFVKPNRNMDLFMASYPFKNKVLVRVTDSPDINETQPQAYTNQYIAYLSDKNGIFNRYVAEFDSSISFVDTTEHYRYFFKSKVITNYDRNILQQNINQDATHTADVIFANGKDMMLITPITTKLNEIEITEPNNTWHRGFIRPVVSDPSNYKDASKGSENMSPEKSKEQNDIGIDFDNYKFDGEKNLTPDKQIISSAKTSGKLDSTQKKSTQNVFRFPTQKNYYTSFYTDYVVTQFDNSFLANNYQVFSGGGSPVYLNPGFNLLTKVAVSDLFEDQRIVGGFRINPSLDNEFMLAWEQRKRRFDHQVVLDRQTYARASVNIPDGSSFTGKIITSTFKYAVKYPFSPIAALRFSVLYRNDKKIALSLGDFSLPKQPFYENLGGLRMEYIFDNTRKVMLNIMNGFRFKVWTEYWRYINGSGRDLFTSGFDARYYQKVHRQITWCHRIAGGNSVGSDRLLFYLGGVDNWINPKFNNNINIVNPSQYGFQTLATEMRGFDQNIRNGNNFLVYNQELRVPVIRYLFNQPLRSDFLNNFQVIGFFDLGMAWNGLNPLSKVNTENTKDYVQTGQNITVTVINQKNPLVAGTGFGLRSRLLGYFVRLDFGWGIDAWVVQRRIIAISLTTDF